MCARCAVTTPWNAPRSSSDIDFQSCWRRLWLSPSSRAFGASNRSLWADQSSIPLSPVLSPVVSLLNFSWLAAGSAAMRSTAALAALVLTSFMRSRHSRFSVWPSMAGENLPYHFAMVWLLTQPSTVPRSFGRRFVRCSTGISETRSRISSSLRNAGLRAASWPAGVCS